MKINFIPIFDILGNVFPFPHFGFLFESLSVVNSANKDWDTWFNFWHNYATTVGKLKVPLGRWTHPTHRKWLWYSSSINDLHRVEDGTVYYYLPAQSKHHTRPGLAYSLAWKEPLRVNHVIGEPVSVQGSDETHVYKLNIGPILARGPQGTGEENGCGKE